MPGTLRLILKRFCCRVDGCNHDGMVTPRCLSAIDCLPNQSEQPINVSVIKEKAGSALIADVLSGPCNQNVTVSSFHWRRALPFGYPVPKEGGILHYSQSWDFNPLPTLTSSLCKISSSVSCNKWLCFTASSSFLFVETFSFTLILPDFSVTLLERICVLLYFLSNTCFFISPSHESSLPEADSECSAVVGLTLGSCCLSIYLEFSSYIFPCSYLLCPPPSMCGYRSLSLASLPHPPFFPYASSLSLSWTVSSERGAGGWSTGQAFSRTGPRTGYFITVTLTRGPRCGSPYLVTLMLFLRASLGCN
ncbi:hypothetical protein GOODEAATRI_004133 [Goodea atripinnis]|uniref:Uncharacterized protein n=1 Tax=Goodea atripinnis TaxID=208336 RepID=A0ABV0PKQ0_9TELE